jgi:hypothetical protein
MLRSYVQVVQEPTGSRGYQYPCAAYPAAMRHSATCPQGLFPRMDKPATVEIFVRDMVISAPVGRDCFAVTASQKENMPIKPRHVDPVGLVDDAAARARRAADPATEPHRGVSLIATEAPIGVLAMRKVAGLGGDANVVVSGFVPSVDAVRRPGASGSAAGIASADVHSHREAESLARLAATLFKSMQEVASTALLNDVMAAAAARNAASSPSTERRSSAVPAFLRDWAFPLSPLFVPHASRVERKLGASGAIKAMARSVEEPLLKGITSAADLLVILDITLAASVRACLMDRPIAVSPSPSQPTPPGARVHFVSPSPGKKGHHAPPEIAMAIDRTKRDDLYALHDEILNHHVAFTALFSPHGLVRVHGKNFFERLNHSERMVVAAFALSIDADDAEEPESDPHSRPPVHTAWSPREGGGVPDPEDFAAAAGAGGSCQLFKELAWRIEVAKEDVAKPARMPCVLQGYSLGDGYVYVACLFAKPAKDTPALPTTSIGHGVVTRVLARAGGDPEPLNRYLTRVTVDVVSGCGTCCGLGKKRITFTDLTEVDYEVPGLMETHLARLKDAHQPQVAIFGQYFGSPAADRIPGNMSPHDAEAMTNGLAALRVAVHACPKLAAAQSHIAGATAAEYVSNASKGLTVASAQKDFDIKDAQEWFVGPEAECAFVVSLAPLGAEGTTLHTDSSGALRSVPATYKEAHRQSVDVCNRFDVPSIAAASTNDLGVSTAIFEYHAPTDAYVTTWPDGASSDDRDAQATELNERMVNSYIRGQQNCSQCPLAWGTTTIHSSVTLDDATGEVAFSAARAWAKHVALAEGSVLRAAVNLAFRDEMKSKRVNENVQWDVGDAPDDVANAEIPE